MSNSEHSVVVIVDIKLNWVLVVEEQSLVSISQISKSTSQVERVLDWGCIVHWSEEMVLESQDDNLFEQFVSHQELLRGTTDVSVTMLESHSCESSLLHLEGNTSS
jgi:hypothetical protein